MDKNFLRNHSIKDRLRRGTLIILFVQVLLFGGAIFANGTVRKLKDEYLTIFDERVLGRKNYIQDTINRYYSSIAELESFIQNEVKESIVENDDLLNSDFLQKISNRAVLALRQSGVTGVFVMFETDEDNEGFYIRDLDPSFNAVDNSDLLLKRGSISIARNINASLDRQWAHKFKLNKDDISFDFYFKPFFASKQYPDADYSDLGYWSKPFRTSPYDVEIITYSVPLKDEFGNFYGIIGIDLTIELLHSLLPYNELERNNQGAYVMAVKNEKDNTFTNVVTSGPIYGKLMSSTDNGMYTKLVDHQGIYVTNNNIYTSSHFFDLYNPNTPFKNERWHITGIVEGKSLFKPITQLVQSVVLSLILSLFLSLIVVFIVGTWFIDPIAKLVQKLFQSDPNKPILLDKTNIKEIDELAIAIESLSYKVADSASKLSQIVSMVNVHIGAFEYILGDGRVFLTDTLFDILGIESSLDDKNYISSNTFLILINDIKQNPELDMENIYFFKKDNNLIWVRLQTHEEDDKILGIIEDVTNDIIAKRKIEYERDHDILTHLLNRRAFNFKVMKKLNDKSISNAAFVMWDLDNLKYINDTYGHDYGDQYIKIAASVLNSSNIYNCIVARMSGDEFYTFIYGYKDKDEIRKIVKDIQMKLHNTFLPMPDRTNLRIRASAGIAWYPDDSNSFDQLIKYSDFAMYEIKNRDKGNVGEFDKISYDKNSILLYGKEELNHLIDGELVSFAFQPIVDAKTGEIFAYEALMRPQVEALKSPLDVLRLAQSQSKLSDIERITWFKSLESFKENISTFKDAKLFINSIPNHVLSDNDLKIFENKYSKYLNRIVVEIIETEQSNEICTNKKKDAVLRWGSHLALDDFGSGYNSEISLLILSPKYIKIDMNIIRGIDKDHNRQKLLENILSYTKNRDIKVIAEGIETKSEMDALIGFGIDYMQGYYLGKPNMIPQDVSSEIKNQIINKLGTI